MDNVEKARVTKVQIGHIEIEGIMLPDSSFGITIPQIARLLAIPPKNATIAFKRALAKDSRFLQVTIAESQNKKGQNYMSLSEFERLLFEFSLKGNQEAIEFARQLVGLSLTQLWSDAFGIKFGSEQRIAYLESRQEHRLNFHKRLTPYWKNDGCEGLKYRDRVIEFKKAAKLPMYKGVDEYSTLELSALNAAEIMYKAFRDCGLDHEQAITKLKEQH